MYISTLVEIWSIVFTATFSLNFSFIDSVNEYLLNCMSGILLSSKYSVMHTEDSILNLCYWLRNIDVHQAYPNYKFTVVKSKREVWRKYFLWADRGPQVDPIMVSSCGRKMGENERCRRGETGDMAVVRGNLM